MNRSKASQRSLTRYFGKKALIVCIVVLIGLIAMLMAMKVSNCSVLVGDAMSARTDYILTGTQDSRDILSRFFTERYINSEELMEERHLYESYNITNYIDLPNVNWIWVWPWSSSASVRVYDKVVSISGTPIVGDDTDETEIVTSPPAWKTGEYSVKVKRVDGRWLIDEIKVIKLDEPPKPAATPTPAPAASPAQ